MTWRSVLEFFENCWAVITNGDFPSQYPCACGHGRGRHRRVVKAGVRIPMRRDCDSCDCHVYQEA